MPKKPTPATQINPPYDPAYAKFIGNLTLAGVGLTRSSSHLDRDGLVSLPKGKAVVEFTQEYKLTAIEKDFFECEGLFRLQVGSSDDGPTVVSLECVFGVHVGTRGKFAKEMAERFTQSEARFVLIPFARQFFFLVTGQMAIPPITIPLTTRSS